MAAREVILDDIKPSIIYTGSWNQSSVGVDPGLATSLQEKLMGPAFNCTSTFTESDSSILFSFTGTQVSLFGAVNFQPTGESGSCFIDGTFQSNLTTVLLGSSATLGTNNNLLCQGLSLPDGPHTLTFNITGMSTHTPLPGANVAPNRVWIDRVSYVPSSDAPLDNVPGVMVFPDDSELNYSSGWETYSDAKTQLTRQPGSSISFTFHGISVAYYSAALIDNSTFNSTASFSLDGLSPVSVPLVPFSDPIAIPNNTPIYRSGPLPLGQHTLTVTYTGAQNSPWDAALPFSYLLLRPTNLIDFSSVTNAVPDLPTSIVPALVLPGSTSLSAAPALLTLADTPTQNSSVSLPMFTPEILSATSSASANENTSTALVPGTTVSNGEIPSANSTQPHTKAKAALTIAGIAISITLMTALGLAFFFVRRYRKNKRRPASSLFMQSQDNMSTATRSTSSTVPVPFIHTNTSTSSLPSAVSHLTEKQRLKLRFPPEMKSQTSVLGYKYSVLTSSSMTSMSNSSLKSPDLADIVVIHSDSGTRLTQPSEEELSALASSRRVIELPPIYAP